MAHQFTFSRPRRVDHGGPAHTCDAAQIALTSWERQRNQFGSMRAARADRDHDVLLFAGHIRDWSTDLVGRQGEL
jgi:hypothetical protein